MPTGLLHDCEWMLSFVSLCNSSKILSLTIISGWQVYSTELGGQTPCYTMPTITYVPATSATIAGLTLITEYVFTRKFNLAESALRPPRALRSGAIAGIAVGIFAGLATIGILIFFYLRRRKAQLEPQTFPTPASGVEMAATSPNSATHELASPPTMARSIASGRSGWVPPLSPPAYELNVDSSRTKPRLPAQELPGSTFITEHHPANNEQEANTTSVAAPSSPPRTPIRTPPQSPRSKTTSSPQIVSPLGSPNLK